MSASRPSDLPDGDGSLDETPVPVKDGLWGGGAGKGRGMSSLGQGNSSFVTPPSRKSKMPVTIGANASRNWDRNYGQRSWCNC